MSSINELKIIAINSDSQPLGSEELEKYKPELPNWRIVQEDGEPRLQRQFNFKDFSSAMAFSNRVGEIAERENHHPALLTEWGKVTVTWWTHKIRGLHLNDLIMAARTDALYQSMT